MRTRARTFELLALLILLTLGGALRIRLLQPKWVFAGSDSYSYLKLGDELWAHGRFSLGPNEPLEWYRRPLYPVFLRLARGTALAEMSGGAGWRRIQLAQGFVDLSSALALYFVARKLAGRLAGFVALVPALFYPPSALLFGAALTECLSMALAVAAIAPLFWLRERPVVAASVSGVGMGLASLLRPDGPLLAVALLPALLWLPTWTARARILAVAFTAFTLVFGAWPLRSLVQFGKLHLADGMVDRSGHDVPHYLGFWRWMQTWSRNQHPAELPQSCFYDPNCKAVATLYSPSDGAFVPPDIGDERQRVESLLSLREQSGITAEVSAGFLALARQRRDLHPLRTLVQLPLERAWAMWTSPQDEILQNPNWRPWPTMTAKLLPYFRKLARWLLALTLAGALLLARSRATSVGAAVLLMPLAVRTLVLGWTAFCLPRYLVGSYPICFVLIGGGVAVAWETLHR